MSKKHRIVVVKWYDACLWDRTLTLEECLNIKMPVYKTYGILLRKDETILHIASESSDNGRFRELNLIPTGSVISIKTLKK